jgi:hypothetical protein
MSLDRFVRYPEGTAGPTQDQVGLVLRNFMGRVGSVEWHEDRFLVGVPGKPTRTFEGIGERPMPTILNEERWIEVWPGPTLDVITRRQDEFTNALAHRLAEIFARYWGGVVEDGT